MDNFEIALKTKNLPTNIEDLAPMALIGATVVDGYVKKIKLLEDLDASEVERGRVLEEAQKAGILVLEIESRIGELSKTIDTSYRNQYSPKTNIKKKHEKMGLKDYQHLQTAQQINNHKEEVLEIISEAFKNDDIPTKKEVIKLILKNDKKRKKERNSNIDCESNMSDGEKIYLCNLRAITDLLHKKPPQERSEEFFKLAKTHVDTIIERFSVFDSMEKYLFKKIVSRDELPEVRDWLDNYKEPEKKLNLLIEK